jgi:tetratricopeptide (TPR) repeat protein
MKKLLYILLFVIASIAEQSVAQNLDSLWKVYNNTAQADTNRLTAIDFITRNYWGNNPDTAIMLAGQEIKLAQTTKQRKYEANAFYNIGVAFYYKSNFTEALKNYLASLKIREELKDKKGIANSCSDIGVIYQNLGNYPEALKKHFTALKAREELKHKQGIAGSYGNIGEIYRLQGNYPEALKNYFASLKIEEEINDRRSIGASYNNIGLVYYKQGNYPEALKNHFAALKIREELKDKKSIAGSYINIGSIYYDQGNYPEALKNYLASLNIKEEIGDKRGIANSYNGIGNIYYSQGNYAEAFKSYFASLKIREEIGDKDGMANSFINMGQLNTKLAAQPRAVTLSLLKGLGNTASLSMAKVAQVYLDSALQLSKEIGSKEWMKESYANLAVLDSTMGNYKAAFEHHKLYIIYRDSLTNEETKKKSMQASMQYEFDKKEIATKAEQDKLDAINAEEKKKQQIVIYAVAGLLVLVGVFAVFMYNRFRITQKQKAVIEEQKVLVDKAYETLHEKNKEVMDSIRYAKRIQTALITSEKSITNMLSRLTKSN